MRVGHIASLTPQQLGASKYLNESSEAKFSDFLTDSIEQAQNAIAVKDFNKDMLLSGEVNNLHDITIGLTESELTLNLAIQIRNKVLDAYTEVMRMQV